MISRQKTIVPNARRKMLAAVDLPAMSVTWNRVCFFPCSFGRPNKFGHIQSEQGEVCFPARLTQCKVRELMLWFESLRDAPYASCRHEVGPDDIHTACGASAAQDTARLTLVIPNDTDQPKVWHHVKKQQTAVTWQPQRGDLSGSARTPGSACCLQWLTWTTPQLGGKGRFAKQKDFSSSSLNRPKLS